MTNCAICGKAVDTARKAGWSREETGWADVRREGGTHALRNRKPTGRVAHTACIRHGAMDSMFDEAKT